ncbi:cupin domain-containing protein [Pseudophaeobacter sp.]|uniref:cupin domain-containing protein n=1 Tax=Pseudophaeobacter sp. TaxID=1971739 RepID=UPI0040587B4B
MPHTSPLSHGPDHVEMATDPAAFAHWPEGLHQEMLQHLDNGVVGSVLVSETDRLRVWHLRIAPGKRCAFHRHVNSYFWSALADGKARGYFCSGEIRDVTHFAGETRHFVYGSEDCMLHSVENIGDTELLFCTVEFIDGPNAPLPIPDQYRLKT